MKTLPADRSLPIFLRSLFLCLFALLPLASAEQPLAVHEDKEVRVELHLEPGAGARAVIVATFTPLLIDPDDPWHLYSKDLPKAGYPAGAYRLGRPTLIELPEGSPLRALGPLEASVASHMARSGGSDVPIPVYPPGPVTLRLPVALPAGDGEARDVELLVWYMLCNDHYCQIPVQGAPVGLSVPTVPGGAQPIDTPADEQTTPESEPRDAPDDVDETKEVADDAGGPAAEGLSAWGRALWIAALLLLGAWPLRLLPRGGAPAAGAVERRRPGAGAFLLGIACWSLALLLASGAGPAYARAASIPWAEPQNVAELEAAIAAAHADGRAALLDFTGPSCVNCQVMAKEVFVLPAVREAWITGGVPIEVNTDPPHADLGDWQKQHFGTEARPLYGRIEPDGSQDSWDRVIAADNHEAVGELAAWLRGEQRGGGRTTEGIDEGWLIFLALAIGGGLFTLVMPCTYPMIPFTVTFFSKQAASGRKLAPLAACYSLGIIGFFIAIGLGIALLGGNVANLSGHPLTNLLIGVLFIVLGLSLLDAIPLRLPAGWESALGGARGGYLGALAMGLTFAITAFTCTAPFAGLVLGSAVSGGGSAFLRAVIGMGVYASVIAIPFFALAVSPGLLQRLPRAGSWMGEFKVVGGLVEIGAAAKFLAITDANWGWGLITRDPSIALWAVLAAVCGAYVLGWLRVKDDQPVTRVGELRLLIALVFFAFAAWLAAGLVGQHLGLFEGFFPSDRPPALR